MTKTAFIRTNGRSHIPAFYLSLSGSQSSWMIPRLKLFGLDASSSVSNRGMRQFWIAMVLVWGLTGIVSGKSTTKSVRKIELHSVWGGLGTPKISTVIIRRENGRYLRNGIPIDAAPIAEQR